MKHLTVFLVALLSTFSVYSCQKKGDKVEEMILGTWDCTEVILDGDGTPTSGIGVSLKVTFKSDNTWSANYDGPYPILDFPGGTYQIPDTTTIILGFKDSEGKDWEYLWKIESLTNERAEFLWPDHQQYTTLENEEFILVFEK
jgi:hypothetical protein